GAAEEAEARLQPFVRKGEVTPAGGALDILPSPAQQRRVLQGLQQVNWQGCLSKFIEAAKDEFGPKAEKAFEPFLTRMGDWTHSINVSNTLSLADVLKGP